SVFPAIRDYNQWVPVPVKYVRAYPSKQNSGTDTPCPGGIPTGPPQIIACTGNPNLRYYIDKRTGGPSIANNEYFSLYANSISNVPNFSQTEYDSFKSSGLPYPRIPSSVLSNQVTWEIPANSKEYETPIWKAERVVLLELPKAAGRRNKVDFNLDATKTFVFQTSSTGSKFEMNEIPKFNFQNEPGDAGGFNNLDSAWLFSDYSTWSYAPKNGNQPDPANGRDFGYFLPKFTVTAE
ncbi:MAG: hypothetical protein O9264_14725, partial [Leptospira sp.]|nr:hypothetical protein [Leptospira sp.]